MASSQQDSHDAAATPTAAVAEQTPKEPEKKTPAKHKRTRSGCFNCRLRRVKCDETKPLCNRCRKRGQECQYPPHRPKRGREAYRHEVPRTPVPELLHEAVPPLGLTLNLPFEIDDYALRSILEDDSISSTSTITSPSDASDGSLLWWEEEEEIFDPNWANRRRTSSASRDTTTIAAVLSRRPDRLPYVSKTAQELNSVSASSLEWPPPTDMALEVPEEWAGLPHEMAYLFNYHQYKLTCHHYLFKADPDRFFKTHFLNYACNYDPLLYGVAAFTAFHMSVDNESSNFDEFLRYYDISVNLLRNEIQALTTEGGQPNVFMLLAILQLQIIEEFRGNWTGINKLLNAAHDILTCLYSPSTIHETPDGRVVFNWLSRLDVTLSMMLGRDCLLGEEWWQVNKDHFKTEAMTHLNDAEAWLEYYQAGSGWISRRTASLLAKKKQQNVPVQDFLEEHGRLSSILHAWEGELTTYRPKDTEMNYLFSFVVCDGTGLQIVLEIQRARSLGILPDKTLLENLSRQICRTYIDAESSASFVPGSMFTAQAFLGIAAMHIPADDKYRDWMRNLLTKLELKGFRFPIAFHEKLSNYWHQPFIDAAWNGDPAELERILSIRSQISGRKNFFIKDYDDETTGVHVIEAL